MPAASLNYLGVVLITGFTTLRHPLLEKQGFYTLGGARARIFTMRASARWSTADADADEKANASNDRPIAKKNEKLPHVCTSMLADQRACHRSRSDGVGEGAPVAPVREPPKRRLEGRWRGGRRRLGTARSAAGSSHAPFRRCSTRGLGSAGRALCTTRRAPAADRRGEAASWASSPRGGDAAHPMGPFKGSGRLRTPRSSRRLVEMAVAAGRPRGVPSRGFESRDGGARLGKERQPRGYCRVPLGGGDHRREGASGRRA